MELPHIYETEHLCMGCMRSQHAPGICSFCGFDESVPMELPIALHPRTVLAEQYLIGRVLGHGGFGITYLGWDLNLNIKLAIKEYFPNHLVTRDGDKSTVSALGTKARESFAVGLERFLAEARILARFYEHPGVVSVLSFFRAHGTGYLVMNYIEGITLKSYIERQGGTVPYELAVKILMPVMDALKEVNSAGVIHRDVSPDNIYITDGGIVKLLDFGAAREALEGSEKSFSVVLKQGYAPPEQYISRGEQGPWTDVYALGATLYRTLYGTSPPESLSRMANDTFQVPEGDKSVPKSLSDALKKALAPHHADRFQTVDEFQNAILAGVDYSDGEHQITHKAPLPALPSINRRLAKRSSIAVAIVSVACMLALSYYFSSGSIVPSLVGEFSFDDGQLQFDGVHRVTIDSEGNIHVDVNERLSGTLVTERTQWNFKGQRGEHWGGPISFNNPSSLDLVFADTSNAPKPTWTLNEPDERKRKVASLIGTWSQPLSALGFIGARSLVVEPSGATRFEARVNGEGRLEADAGRWKLIDNVGAVIDEGSYDSSTKGDIRFVGKRETFRLVRANGPT